MTLGTSAAEIVFDHVTKRYPGSSQPAIDDLSLSIPEGEICVLIGTSGGGKTNAIKMVNRLIPSCAAESATSSSRSGCSRT